MKSSKIDNKNRSYLRMGGFLGYRGDLGAVGGSVKKGIHVAIRVVVQIESLAFTLEIRKQPV